MEQRLQNLYPELVIEGSNYLPNPSVMTIVSVLEVMSWIIIALMLFGDYIFNTLNIQPPQLYLRAKENSMMVIVMSFFLTNMVKQSLLATGAFEVSLNGETIFSKLETGRLPSWPELTNHLERLTN
eukprot:m.57434 g.57434  ORF g.57434 m.57434 type:complete len:126 (+) comp13083_c0_seq1:150-527(+)